MPDPSAPLKPVIGMSDALVEFRKGLLNTPIPQRTRTVTVQITDRQLEAARQLGMGYVTDGIRYALDKIPA